MMVRPPPPLDRRQIHAAYLQISGISLRPTSSRGRILRICPWLGNAHSWQWIIEIKGTVTGFTPALLISYQQETLLRPSSCPQCFGGQRTAYYTANAPMTGLTQVSGSVIGRKCAVATMEQSTRARERAEDHRFCLCSTLQTRRVRIAIESIF